VEGFLAGGADEVVIWDGHDGSQTIAALTVDPKAVSSVEGGGAEQSPRRSVMLTARPQCFLSSQSSRSSRTRLGLSIVS
jgi:hypothetical protein